MNKRLPLVTRKYAFLMLAIMAGLFAGCQGQPPTAMATATEQSMPTAAPPTATVPMATATPEDTPTAEPTVTTVATATTETAAEMEEEMQEEESAAFTFTPVSEGPVVPHGPSGRWDSQYTDPGAVVYHDGMFHMFHNGFVGWPAPVGIAYSTSPDGYTWTRVQEDPVFRVVRGDGLDYVGLTLLASDALVEEDGTWVLYFYTWDQPTWPTSTSSIGRATAPDPLGPWTADPEPVLTPGTGDAWDNLAVRAPSVLRTGDEYVMYYAGYTSQQGMIGMATSPDGVQWTRYDDPATTEEPFAASDPIFEPGSDGDWDGGNVFHPRVVQAADGYAMVYSAAPRLNATSTLGYAVSRDGLDWQRAPQPILDFSMVPGGRAIWFSALAHVEQTYFLYFELGTGGQTEVYVATHEGELPGP